MNLSVTVAPTPLPGKTQPTPNPAVNWVDRDLVKADVEYTSAKGPKRSTHTYQAMGMGPLENGYAGMGPVGIHAFAQSGATSFRDAVEAASQIAAKHPLHLNVVLKDPTEKSVSLAIAVLQAANGAYYTTSLHVPGVGASLTVDTGRTNFTIHDVQQLHPDVKAVVGAHSWVNFTNEKIEPTLAG